MAVGMAVTVLSIATSVGAGGYGWASTSLVSLRGAIQDGTAGFYMTQAVRVSFFHHTAGLRFAAPVGLAIVGSALVLSTALASRLLNGSEQKRLILGALTALPYGALSALISQFVPLRVSAPVIGRGTAVSLSVLEAFFLPLLWGTIFASLGALFGVFGRRWKHEALRLAGSWANAVRCAVRGVVAGLMSTSAVALIGGMIMAEQAGVGRWMTSGGIHRIATVSAGVLLTVPSLLASVFLSGFGVSFTWHVEALSSSRGTASALGGTLPTIGQASGQAVPSISILLMLVGACTSVYVGWLAARQRRGNALGGMGDALRAGAVLVAFCWLAALFASVDAQMGGLLGASAAATPASLLTTLPVFCLVGPVTGAAAYIVLCGPATKLELRNPRRLHGQPRPSAPER